jgi:serine/threonine-protein kinase
MPAITEQLTTALGDRYVLERELGQGGMALVYLARDLKHNRKVALKVLRPELAAVIGAERFLKEIEVTANLQHPHILPLHDSGEAGPFLYYVMPYVEGETLRARLLREKQLGIDEAVELTRSVAAALDYAHRQRVIHRDIKPENILLHDGQPLIADFGIALAVSAAGGTRLTETGLSLGTPHYMSPEQAMGDRELDARSDIYSLGAVLYEMLAGDPPYTGSTAQAIVAKVITEKAQPVTLYRETVPPHVAAAIHKALAKLPADRFHTAAEFAAALARPGFTAGSVAAGAARLGVRRVDARVAAAAAIGTLILGAGAVWLSRPAPAPGPLGRFAIGVEPITSLGSGFAQQVALSPDGRLLAFVGRGPRGNQIFLRAMADSIPRPVAGTDGAFGPFFSADGRQIGFWTPQRLLRIPVEGGAATLIADSAGAFAAWTDGGAVVYADPEGRRLRVVDADGRRRDLVRSDTSTFLAISPLPGGRHVLAAVLTGGRNRTGIFAVSLADGAMRDVGLPDAVMARYTPSGHLVYQRRVGGPLMAVPFDLGRLRVRGEGQPVAPDARITFRVVAQWDAAATAIVYVPPAPLQLVLTDREGRVTMLQEQSRSYHHPRFSPDGRRIALDITDPEARDVWIVDVGDGRLTRLTVGETANDPFWSPDGRRLAYATLRGAVRSMFIRNADGSGTPDSVYGDQYDHSSGAWTPDGRALIVSTALTAGLWALPVDGKGAAAVPGSRSSEAYPAISRDGRWLAYVSDESGRQEVYVRPYPGPGGRIQVSVNGGSEAVWTRDGRELLYREDAGPRSRLISAAVRTTPTFEVTGRAALFDVSNFVPVEDHANYDVHPDGRRFVFVQSLVASRVELIQNWAAQLRGTEGR